MYVTMNRPYLVFLSFSRMYTCTKPAETDSILTLRNKPKKQTLQLLSVYKNITFEWLSNKITTKNVSLEDTYISEFAWLSPSVKTKYIHAD